MKKYMIIDARGNYWCENGEPYDFGGYVVVSKDEKSLSVSAEQWDALQKEVLGYVGFRIDQLLERGCW